MPTLLLVGHGSEYGPESGAPVHAHAARLRARAVHHDVRVAFWKEEPHLRDAFDSINDRDVCVVPIFMSEGYFTSKIVPRELKLTGQFTQRGETRVHYCPPIGTHHRMVDLVEQRIRGTWPAGAAREDVAVIIAGHGTPRSPSSAQSTHAVTAQLRERNRFGLVACGFLDQPPMLRDIAAKTANWHTIVVPFFVSAGYHTRTSIPNEIALGGGDPERVRYTEPVGTADEIADLILELAENAV